MDASAKWNTRAAPTVHIDLTKQRKLCPSRNDAPCIEERCGWWAAEPTLAPSGVGGMQATSQGNRCGVAR